MARLPRVTQKIFAGNSPSNQVTTFGSIKAGSPVYTKDISQIMNANYDAGWSDAVEDDYAPYRQDRNAVDLTHSFQLAYIFQEGVAEWDSNTTYYNGSVVKLIDDTKIKLYRSIADNNTSTLNDTTKWVLFLNISNTGVISSPTIDNPTMTGTVTMPTPSASDSSTKGATTAYVQNNLTGAISTVKTANLTHNRVLVSNDSGKIAASSTTTATEIGYVHGVTSNIQTQINDLQTALNNLPQLMFPVGSIYSTIGNTNPNTILGFGTWTLLTSSIITEIESTVPVKGDGKALSMTNGTQTFSLATRGSETEMIHSASGYGQAVGSGSVPNENYYAAAYAGLTTDATKSGIIADTSGLATSKTMYIWKRTA